MSLHDTTNICCLLPYPNSAINSSHITVKKIPPGSRVGRFESHRRFLPHAALFAGHRFGRRKVFGWLKDVERHIDKLINFSLLPSCFDLFCWWIMSVRGSHAWYRGSCTDEPLQQITGWKDLVCLFLSKMWGYITPPLCLQMQEELWLGEIRGLLGNKTCIKLLLCFY